MEEKIERSVALYLFNRTRRMRKEEEAWAALRNPRVRVSRMFPLLSARIMRNVESAGVVRSRVEILRLQFEDYLTFQETLH